MTLLADCDLGAYVWRAQYYYNETVLVEDILTFSDADKTFGQNTTTFPFQPCASNWIYWTGAYDHADPVSLYLDYKRCSVSGAGCLACGPTRSEAVSILFDTDCTSLDMTFADGVERTYFSHAKL